MKHLASLLALTWLLAASASPAEFDHTHAALDQLLKKHVTDALVDYPALKADSEKLDACLDEMAAVREADFQNWTQLQKLAFLINLYNAATLRLVLDHHPVKSIKKIGGLLSGPWDQPVARLFAVTVTLGHVEHEILRRGARTPCGVQRLQRRSLREHQAPGSELKFSWLEAVPNLRGEPGGKGRPPRDGQLGNWHALGQLAEPFKLPPQRPLHLPANGTSETVQVKAGLHKAQTLHDEFLRLAVGWE